MGEMMSLDGYVKVADGCLDRLGGFLIGHNLGTMTAEIDEVRRILKMAADQAEMSEEKAIDYLQQTGWMQRHDRAMSFDSLTAVVNGLMLDGNKTISVNIYPWKEDGDETA